jgi:hypothetical protein
MELQTKFGHVESLSDFPAPDRFDNFNAPFRG